MERAGFNTLYRPQQAVVLLPTYSLVVAIAGGAEALLFMKKIVTRNESL
jgi:hypothetical protein